jgi:SAM-dependent methyltransferase
VNGIYDEPELYELACAYRDVPGEVDALRGWFGRHAEVAGAAGPAPATVLELAAGPAEHAREFARRGASATALDLSAAMCARAGDLARQDGLELAVVQADMRDFQAGPPRDLVITMLNSVCHLMTLDDMVAHLRAAAAHTAPGGLYIMELAHPADILSRVPRTSSEWSSEVGERHIRVRWGGTDDPIDPVTQVTRERVQITVRDESGSRTLTDVVPNRFWSATEITAAIRLAGGFRVVASYGDFADAVAVGAPSAWRMIMVLRRDRAGD